MVYYSMKQYIYTIILVSTSGDYLKQHFVIVVSYSVSGVKYSNTIDHREHGYHEGVDYAGVNQKHHPWVRLKGSNNLFKV